MSKHLLKWLILIGGGLFGWELIYQTLQFPSLSMGCTFVISAWFISMIEQSRFKANHAYFIRNGLPSASVWRRFYVFGLIFLKASSLSILSYFLSCQCRIHPIIAMQFPTLCLGLLCLIHYLEGRPWGQRFYLIPLFYSYFAVVIGFINTLLLYPSAQDENNLILKLLDYLRTY